MGIKSIIRSIYGKCGLRFLRKTIITPLKIRLYNNRKQRILTNISSKTNLTVVFMPIDISMWKYDGVVNQMKSDPRIKFYIIPSLYPDNTREHNKHIQDMMRSHFMAKGYPYIDGYDFIKEKWFDARTLNPDVVIFTQPYNVGHKYFRIEHFWKNSVFVYTPYGMVLEYIEGFYNMLLQNIAYRLFYPTIFNYYDAQKLAYNKGTNIVVTGYPIEDEFKNHTASYEYIWKQKDPAIKRVIWAPHHSITNSETIDYSTFLEIADSMLELCNKYMGKIQFAFKPHPVLKKKLYLHKSWGKEKTDLYYARWQEMPNSIIAEHDYVDLFLTSDAMIHDCSSFTAEYLYAGNPVMYLSKSNHLSYANEFGKRCYEVHYHGSCISHVYDFIDDVVIGGNDTLKKTRNQFVDEHLSQHNTTVAEKIYKEIVALMERH